MTAHIDEHGRVGQRGGIEELEALADLVFDEVRGALEALVRVFVVDGAVVLLGIFAAGEEQLDEGVELAVSVGGVVDMVWGLGKTGVRMRFREVEVEGWNLPSCPFSASYVPSSVRLPPYSSADCPGSARP